MRWGETVRVWGSTAEERQRSFPCDRILPDHNEAYYRAVTITSEPAIVFRWLCQIRVAPYSYDWIDNYGRKSPSELTEGLENLALGQRFMSIFELVDFEQDVHITLQAIGLGRFPPGALSYVIEAQDDTACRLIVKIVVQYRPGLLDRVIRLLFPSLDWIMMRRQLLNLKALAEGGGSA
ncbi:MAG: hypothetical protein IID08_03250 [Candidatus Hydrogenedentes bacterium]|nr:hypothetical protein [Candidatus Hydrogenedentota bacterium]